VANLQIKNADFIIINREI